MLFSTKKSISFLAKWFHDNFELKGFRACKNGIFKNRIKVSSNPDDVIVGKDNWLFLGNQWANTLNQYMGLDPFSQKELESFIEVLRAKNAWLNARDIPMVFAIAPDKSTIYPEYLPAWVRKGEGPTRREQLVARLKETDLFFIDTTEAVLKAKKNALTFYKTDSHWNSYGAWVGYKTIMDFIRNRIGKRGFRVIEDQDFRIEQSIIDGFALPQRLGLNGKDMPDIEVVLKLSDQLSEDLYHHIKICDIGGRSVDPGEVSEDKKIGKATIRSVTCDAIRPDGVRVLILMDSFATNMSPYFNLSFRETTYCAWLQGPGKEMTRLVERFNVNLVIWILVERTLKLPHRIHPSWRIADGKTLKERWQHYKVISGGDGLSLLEKAANKDIAEVRKNINSFDVTLSTDSRLKLGPLLKGGQPNQLGCLRLQITSGGQTVVQVRFRLAGKDGKWKQGYRTAHLYEGVNDLFFELPISSLMQPIELATFKENRCQIKDWQIIKSSKSDV